MRAVVLALALCVVVVFGQKSSNSDGNPTMSLNTCTGSGCTSATHNIVLDSNWRWVHNSNGQNCYTGAKWNDGTSGTTNNCNGDCANNCELEGVTSSQYVSTYGINNPNNALELTLVTGSGSTANIGSRVYMLDTDNVHYKVFGLLNREFTFDVDVSDLPCGVNGALYFTEMPANGDMGVGSNQAGAAFGTGYCDAQCPQDLKFIHGMANNNGWTPSTQGDSNSGTGTMGACCAEMDIWEANSMATALTPHPCTSSGLTVCSATGSPACGNPDTSRYTGVCDRDGCDFNTYRVGNQTFFGNGKTVDTTKPMTVVTQFLTSDGTDTGSLSEIRRFYKQGNTVFANGASSSASAFSALDGANSITPGFCTAQKTLFGDTNDFATKGGLTALGQALGRGVVLVMSLWVDYDANCLWLDSTYPTSGNANTPGIGRGSCPTSSGKPSDIISATPTATVKFSNIKFGTIGSTTPGVSSTGTTGSQATAAATTGSQTTAAATTAATTGSQTTAAATSAATSGSQTTATASTTGSSCSVGAPGCPCTSGGGCNPGLSCLSNVCVALPTPSPVPTCQVGAESCTCIGGDSCDPGLSCIQTRCVKSNDGAASTVALSALVLGAAVMAYFF